VAVAGGGFVHSDEAHGGGLVDGLASGGEATFRNSKLGERRLGVKIKFGEGRLSAEETPYSFGLSATSQQYFSLITNQPSTTSQQYFSLRTNQHQPSATGQTNRLLGKLVTLFVVYSLSIFKFTPMKTV
jgi:hypothetical protein